MTSVGVRSNLRPASSLEKAVVHPGLDPEAAVELIQTVLRLAAYFFAGSALVGLGVYIALLCVEIFSPQPRSKARLAKLPHRLGTAPVAEQNRDPIMGDTPTPAEAASVTEEEVTQEGLNSKLLCQQKSGSSRLLLNVKDGEPVQDNFREHKTAPGTSAHRAKEINDR